MASHFLDCLTMQWYSLPTTPCTCPPWVGLDPDGWYRLDCADPDGPRIVEFGDDAPDDEAPLTLDDAIHELQTYEQQQDDPA
ncbi:MAG TPA: hypothetical protein VLK35_17630 [Methylomirabilota bacterium]|nr:hypothetical protein [Methylomirabilota bacterium]